MTEYMISGTSYNPALVDVEAELIPKNSLFRCYPLEMHNFYFQHGKINNDDITKALEKGVFSDFDKSVLLEVAIFASGYCVSRMLRERLALRGITFEYETFEKSLKLLSRYHLIQSSKFCYPNGKQVGSLLISMTVYGWNLAKKLGINSRFNPYALATNEPHNVKAYGQGAQLLTNIQKNLPVESFVYRPVYFKNSSLGEIVRPTFTVNIWGETLHCEVVRRFDTWQETLLEKLERYIVVFGKDNPQTVIINCEDEKMCRETAEFLSQRQLALEFIYTDDLASFGTGFRSCFYGFDSNGNKCHYQICEPQQDVSRVS